jgi:hypothetical protein
LLILSNGDWTFVGFLQLNAAETKSQNLGCVNGENGKLRKAASEFIENTDRQERFSAASLPYSNFARDAFC